MQSAGEATCRDNQCQMPLTQGVGCGDPELVSGAVIRFRRLINMRRPSSFNLVVSLRRAEVLQLARGEKTPGRFLARHGIMLCQTGARSLTSSGLEPRTVNDQIVPFSLFAALNGHCQFFDQVS